MGPSRPVLVTRPPPGLARTCDTLAAMGHVPVAAPMLGIETCALAPHAGVPPQAVIATSGNALAPLAAAGMRGLRLFAVGEATASRARGLGFADIVAGGGEQEALARTCRALLDPGVGALLLASGAGQGAPLAAALRAAGFRVRRRVAYRQVPAPAWPEAADRFVGEAGDGGRPAALFLSGSAAASFARLLPAGRRDGLGAIEALGISAAALRPVARLPWLRLRVAVRPTAEDVLGLL